MPPMPPMPLALAFAAVPFLHLACIVHEAPAQTTTNPAPGRSQSLHSNPTESQAPAPSTTAVGVTTSAPLPPAPAIPHSEATLPVASLVVSKTDAPSGFFASCSRTTFETGWVQLRCGETEYLLQSPGIHLGSKERMVGHYTDHLRTKDRVGTVRTGQENVRLGGRRVQLRKHTMKALAHDPWSDNDAPPNRFDPNGDIRASGLFAQFQIGSDLYAVGCRTPSGARTHDCRAGFRELSAKGIPGKPAPIKAILNIAGGGIPVGECKRYGPQYLSCKGGSFDYRTNQASSRELFARFSRILEPSAGASDVKTTREEYRCKIGNAPAKCIKYQSYGVLSSPYRTSYLAISDNDQFSASCFHDTDKQISAPCRRVFVTP